MPVKFPNTHHLFPIPQVKDATLVQPGLGFRLGQASLPRVRPFAAFASLIGLRGGAVASSAEVAVGSTGRLHSGDALALVLLLTIGASVVDSQGASGVRAPWREGQWHAAIGGQLPLTGALGLLKGPQVVEDSLLLHGLQDGTATVGTTSLH